MIQILLIKIYFLRTILPKRLGLTKVTLLKHRKKGLSCVLVMKIKRVRNKDREAQQSGIHLILS